MCLQYFLGWNSFFPLTSPPHPDTCVHACTQHCVVPGMCMALVPGMCMARQPAVDVGSIRDLPSPSICMCIYIPAAAGIIHFQNQHAFIFITFCSITILMGLSMGKDKRSIFNVYLTVANFTWGCLLGSDCWQRGAGEAARLMGSQEEEMYLWAFWTPSKSNKKSCRTLPQVRLKKFQTLRNEGLF